MEWVQMAEILYCKERICPSGVASLREGGKTKVGRRGKRMEVHGGGSVEPEDPRECRESAYLPQIIGKC